MVVHKNHRLIQNPVEHLQWSALTKITNNTKLLAVFAKKTRSWMFAWVLNTPLKMTQHIQCLELFCECVMQILIFLSSQSMHLFSSFCIISAYIVFYYELGLPCQIKSLICFPCESNLGNYIFSSPSKYRKVIAVIGLPIHLLSTCLL